MGLDMYLSKKSYIGANCPINEAEGVIDIKTKRGKANVNFKKVTYIEEDIGYWRKANQIHNWFVNNIQGGVDNCSTYYVSLNSLKELKGLCQQVLDARNKPGGQALAEELLPPQSGFFFGGTDIDEYYYEDLEETVKIVEECEKYPEDEFTYHSSW